MVGLDNAGKTTILYQFLMNEVVHTSPTIGSNVEEIVWKNIHFLVWDLAGMIYRYTHTKTKIDDMLEIVFLGSKSKLNFYLCGIFIFIT